MGNWAGIDEENRTADGAFLYPPDFQDPRWYVLFVRSNREKKVVHSLGERGVENLLPTYKALRQWKDRRVALELPLFPGYVFVRLPFIDRQKALTVPNVVSLIGRKGAPAVISEDEIHWIREGVRLGTAAPHSYIAEGQRVTISGGALSGLHGTFVRVQNNMRVLISLDSIQRSFTVELDESWIEPSAASGAGDAGFGGATACRCN